MFLAHPSSTGLRYDSDTLSAWKLPFTFRQPFEATDKLAHDGSRGGQRPFELAYRQTLRERIPRCRSDGYHPKG
jgi:hypothetical protein